MAVIVAACVLNILDVTGQGRQRWLVVLALADIALQLAVIAVGVFAVFHPDRLTAQLDLFTDPSLTDAVYAAVVAMLAYAGIEAASDLAPDIDVRRRGPAADRHGRARSRCRSSTPGWRRSR